MNKLIAILVTTISMVSWAGPEHDHGAPTFQPPKGGILQSTHGAHFELVKTGNKVNIYAYNQEGKSVPTKDLKVSAELELPRKKGGPITLSDKSTHWEATVDSQGAHRYTINLIIDDGKEKDNVKFTVENK